jgi:hypothetical protein
MNKENQNLLLGFVLVIGTPLIVTTILLILQAIK